MVDQQQSALSYGLPCLFAALSWSQIFQPVMSLLWAEYGFNPQCYEHG